MVQRLGIASAAAFVLVVSTLNNAQTPAPAPARVDFATEIRPIFRQYCVDCHGPKAQKNGLRLDRRKDAMRGGTIAVIGPGNADGSRLYHRLVGDRFGMQMPPTGPLPAEKIARITAWINQGAEWPDALGSAGHRNGCDGQVPPFTADEVGRMAAARQPSADRGKHGAVHGHHDDGLEGVCTRSTA